MTKEIEVLERRAFDALVKELKKLIKIIRKSQAVILDINGREGQKIEKLIEVLERVSKADVLLAKAINRLSDMLTPLIPSKQGE